MTTLIDELPRGSVSSSTPTRVHHSLVVMVLWRGEGEGGESEGSR